jgi:metal-responsive CopG/Arc/MetJ family transcriptional regulator
MSDSKKVKVLWSVPAQLLKQLDSAAKKSKRNRSAEACVLVSEGLRAKRTAKAGAGARS